MGCSRIILRTFIILAAPAWLLSACTAAPEPLAQAASYAAQWFAQARQGARQDSLCHAMGLLKHPQFSCNELLEHAARIDPLSRQLNDSQTRKCVASVCGEFYELTYSSRDDQGNEGEEIVLLKRDNGQFRVYWYRSASLLAMLAPADADTRDSGKSADQAAYDELTQQHPSLYQYPPCYQTRVSSSNLRGQLTAMAEIDPGIIEQQADVCGSQFCLAFIGTKVASVCPQ